MKALKLLEQERAHYLAMFNDKSISKQYDEAIEELKTLTASTAQQTTQSKFKVGDWVCFNNKVMKVTDGTSPIGLIALNNDGNAYMSKDLSLWQPKPGQWCWFWNDDMRIPVLDNFVYNKVDNVVTFTELNSKPYVANILDKAYQYCEPFLGTLPSTVNTRQ